MSKTINLTQDKVATVDDGDYEWLNKWKWYYSNVGYACRDIRINGKRTCVLMHRLINSTPMGMETDHINCNGLDNRRCNLRSCNKSQNQMNREKAINRSSGEKGVYWKDSRKKWTAKIMINYKEFYLGDYKNIEDAINAYNKKALELFGEFTYKKELTK